MHLLHNAANTGHLSNFGFSGEVPEYFGRLTATLTYAQAVRAAGSSVGRILSNGHMLWGKAEFIISTWIPFLADLMSHRTQSARKNLGG